MASKPYIKFIPSPEDMMRRALVGGSVGGAIALVASASLLGNYYSLHLYALMYALTGVGMYYFTDAIHRYANRKIRLAGHLLVVVLTAFVLPYTHPLTGTVQENLFAVFALTWLLALQLKGIGDTLLEWAAEPQMPPGESNLVHDVRRIR